MTGLALINVDNDCSAFLRIELSLLRYTLYLVSLVRIGDFCSSHVTFI